MTALIEPTDSAGAMTLLRECVGGSAGERLLIVRENADAGFYDDKAPGLVAEAGRSLGMRVFETQSLPATNDEQETRDFISSLAGFDHVVFFSRVGDQIRFAQDLDMPSSTMCYTLNRTSLNSSFGTACYHGMLEVKDAINRAFESARQIRVTCPRGTDYSGHPAWSDCPVDVSLKRFPLLVPRPVPADGFSGKVALSRFLIGTGSRHYDPYYLALPNDVIACIENNSITRFEGPEEDVNRVSEHYLHVSNEFSIDPWYVDSWHAGIHPGCHFEADAEADILRWSGTAFGNPRILHFHTCGNYAPGEISWNILDPTVYFDGVAVWEAGQLYPERLADGSAIMERHPNLATLFANPARDIGLSA